MADYPFRKARGVDQIQATDPSHYLFAGDLAVKTGRAKVKAGLVLAIFSMLAYDASGLLVPWDPDGGTVGTNYADGTLTMGGQPTAADTVTLGNLGPVTFVASVTVPATQVLIGASAAATANNLRAFIIAHTAAIGFNVSSGGATGGTPIAVTANVPGTVGNSLALAKSGTYPSVSAATLTGGTDIEAGATPESKLAAVLAEPLDTSAAGTNADTFCGIYEQANFNHEALPWPAALDTLQKRQASLVGSKFLTGRLP